MGYAPRCFCEFTLFATARELSIVTVCAKCSRTPTLSKAPSAKVMDADKYLSVLSHFIAGWPFTPFVTTAQTSVPKPRIRVRADD